MPDEDAPDGRYIDLQWFAAEDEGRTEEPTAARLRKARLEEGLVAKSRELVSAVGLLLPSLALLFLAPAMLRDCIEMTRFFFERVRGVNEADPLADAAGLAAAFLSYFARLTLPLLAAAVIAALLSNIVQVGLVFAAKPLRPKAERVLPRFGLYFGKTLFSANGLFNLLKALAKIGLVGGAAFLVIRSGAGTLAGAQAEGPELALRTVASLAARLLLVTALLLLALSVPDYLFQRRLFRDSMKMTPREAADERRQDEGDPRVRQRLRQRMREMLTGIEAVPRADVVVTNPTHFAVALQYRQEFEGPLVLAKGEDALARRIRLVAAGHGVPVVENKPLARALYGEVDAGAYVPAKYWTAVVAVLQRVKTLDELKKLVGI
jgi:flagellar biosynthetic protein FlhB